MLPKLLIITKDCPKSSETEDLRIESFRVNEAPSDKVETIDQRLHHNILAMVWGLTHYSLEKQKCPDWEDKEHPWTWDEAREYFETHPIPRINAKKVAGENTIDDATLLEYMNDKDYKPLFIRQILLIDADIVVCCGRKIFEFVIDPANGIFSDITEDKINDPWIYFSAAKQKIVINSFHPSYWGIDEDKFYKNLMSEYESFLNTHKDLARRWFGNR